LAHGSEGSVHGLWFHCCGEADVTAEEAWGSEGCSIRGSQEAKRAREEEEGSRDRYIHPLSSPCLL
jgi:hypothetical protein